MLRLPGCALKSREFKILNKYLTLINRTHRARSAQELSRGEGHNLVKGMGIFVFYFYFLQNSKNEITSSLTDSWKIVSVLEYGRQWRDLNSQVFPKTMIAVLVLSREIKYHVYNKRQK